MKILMLIDRKYPTDHVFLEEVYSKRFKEMGHNITWIMKSNKKISDIKTRRWNGNLVYILPSHQNILMDNILLIKYLKFIKSLIKKENFDIMYVRNDSIMGLYVSKLSKKFKIPFVYQLTHLKSEETIYFSKKSIYGNRSKNFIIGKIDMFLRNKVLKKANLVLPISQAMKSYLKKKRFRKSAMEILPLGADINIDRNQIKENNLKRQYNLGSEPILIYIGTLVKTRNPFFLFDVVKKLIVDYPKLKLFIVGEGKNEQDSKDYNNYVKEKKISKNVIFTKQIPRSDMPKYLKIADIGLSVFPPVSFLKMNSPIKLMEYMNMELPVVCNDFNDEQRIIVNKAKCGFCVNYDTNSFHNTIKILLKNKKLRKKMGRKGRQYIIKNRSYEILTKKVESYLNSLLK